MDIFQNIIFLYPYAFILLIIYIICQKYCKEKSQSIYFSNLKMLDKVSSNNNMLINILKFTIVFFIILALATPVKKEDVTLNNNKGYEISLMIDVSAGMRDDDKFKITKKIVKEFIQKRKTDRLALSVFANFAYTAVPLTYDKNSLLQTLNYIEVGVAGYRDTALYEALYLGSDICKHSTTKNKIAILLTDGLNTVDTISLNTAIKKAKKYGIKVYTIGVGNNIYFSTKALQKIAKETGGKYYAANKPQKLKDIYDNINQLEKSKIKTIKYNYYKYFFQYPIYISIFLILILIFIFINNKSYNYKKYFSEVMFSKIFVRSINKKLSFYFLIISFILLVITAYRPTIDGKEISIQSNNASFIVAFDISRSMQSKDIYPSRFEFLKNKFYTIVDNLTTQRVGILGFAKEPFLIAPITNDYKSLKFIVQNLTTKNIDTKGSKILPLLEKTDEFLDKSKHKILLILTDGTQKRDFTEEIVYANTHNIKVFIYTIATVKGAPIKVGKKKKHLLKDKNNNIIITSLNENIKQLSIQTQGQYINHSLDSSDINKLLTPIKKILSKEQLQSNKIKNNTELFQIPLILAFIFYILGTTGIINKRNKQSRKK